MILHHHRFEISREPWDQVKIKGDGQECPSHIIDPNLHAVGALAD
jgi:hypothetical protein